MSSLIAKPYTKLDQDQVDTKIPDEIVDGGKESANVDTADTRNQKSTGDSAGGWEKRYKDLQAYHDRETQKLKDELTSAKKESFKAPTTPEELAAFKEKHGDIYNVIRTIAMEESGKSEERVADKVDSVSKSVQRSAADSAKKAIMEAHPDFNKIANSQEFHSWAEDQTPEIQKWIYKNPDNATLAIKAINLYKAETGYKNEAEDPKKGKKASDAKAAEQVTTSSAPEVSGGKKVWKASEIKSLTPAQFDKLESEIDAAWEEGRVDLTN